MEKITFCIPSKNNLRYLKNSIQSIKENSVIEHSIIVFVDQDNDGTIDWLIKNNINYLVNKDKEPKGIAYGYNRCIEAATTSIVCMFHADMYMAKGFDTAILKYLKPKSVVSGTRIEPPLHPEGLEKIVKNFGIYPEDFNQLEFNTFTQEAISNYLNKTTRGIFAPWAIYKEDITSIGMHDEYFHSYHEDSDIFNRFILNKYEIIQTWEGFVYHLTCRGGQFQDGVEKITNDPFFHKMKNNALKNYIRKWGSSIKNDKYQYPIVSSKYDIGFLLLNDCSYQLLEVLEPWCSNICIKNDTLKNQYIEKEQPNTNINLTNKFLDNLTNNIIIKFDPNKLTQQSFNTLAQISEILLSVELNKGEVGYFELDDIFEISISDLKTYDNDLIFLKS